MWWILVACYTEDAFREDLDDAVCEWKQECYQEDLSDCLRDAIGARQPVPAGCEFRPDDAQQCVDQVAEMDCEDELSEAELGFPEECGRAWVCR